MSSTQYMKIKHLFVPKHLAVSQDTRKKEALKRDFLIQSPAEVVQRLKKDRLKPIGEI